LSKSFGPGFDPGSKSKAFGRGLWAVHRGPDWKKSSVLKESADVLEVVLTILKQLGYSYDDPKRAWPVT
jgi:hypothetical protein